MSELILYDFGNSVCCQKVRITLRAKLLEWRAIRVDLFKAEQYDPQYRKLNPKGVVPTLVHDGKPVIESTLICEYIDQTFPQAPQLIPADPWQQSRMRLWSKMVDDGLVRGRHRDQLFGDVSRAHEDHAGRNPAGALSQCRRSAPHRSLQIDLRAWRAIALRGACRRRL